MVLLSGMGTGHRVASSDKGRHPGGRGPSEGPAGLPALWPNRVRPQARRPVTVSGSVRPAAPTDAGPRSIGSVPGRRPASDGSAQRHVCWRRDSGTVPISAHRRTGTRSRPPPAGRSTGRCGSSTKLPTRAVRSPARQAADNRPQRAAMRVHRTSGPRVAWATAAGRTAPARYRISRRPARMPSCAPRCPPIRDS